MARTPGVQRYSGNRRNRWGQLLLPAAVGAVGAGYRAYRSMARQAAQQNRSTVTQTKTKRRPYTKPKYMRVTRGYSKKPFRKARKYTFSKLRTKGTQTVIEAGSVVTSTDAVYIGHAVPISALFTEICRAITKRIFQKAGHRILSMGDKIQDDSVTYLVSPCQFVLQLRRIVNDPVQNVTLPLGADITYNDAAEVLRLEFLDLYSDSTATRDNILLDELFLVPNDSTNNPIRMATARLWLGSMQLHMGVSSKLQLQNRTLASSGGTADESNMLDVANNPLDGKVYSGSGNMPSIKFSNQIVGVLTDDFSCNRNSGVIDCDPSLSNNYTNEMLLILKRPPSGYAFNHVTKCANVTLSPGAIKKSFFQYSRRINLQTFMQIMHSDLLYIAQGLNHRNSIGKFNMYGFQKRCNTRVDEPSISIGYELNTTISVAVSEKPTVTLRDVNVV